MRSRHLLLALIIATTPIVAHVGAQASPAPRRPNIVVIMADDMGFSDIGCYGSEIRTPNLDGLAANGLRFTQFYNTGRCCPTRAALLTGLYPHQAGIGHMVGDRGADGYRGDLNDRCVTIAEVLKTAGYATYMAGKWHVTRQVGEWTGDDARTSRHDWPRQRGFDRFFGTIHGGGSYYDPSTLTSDNDPIEPGPGPFYYTDAISDAAARFVTQHEGAEPFFLYVAYTAPHWPMHALPDDIARYRGVYDDGWDALRARRHARMIELGIVDAEWPLSPRGDGVPSFNDAKHRDWHREVMAVYAAMIDRLDQGIGRITGALEASGRLEDTLILFLADNGGCAEGGRQFEKAGSGGGLSRPRETRDGRPVRYGNQATVMPGPDDTFQEYGRSWANASNTPFRYYKHFVHEGGIASPLIVHWPRGIADCGVLRNEPGHVIDLMATCVDVAGATYPDRRRGKPVVPMAGRSLAPAFAGRPIERDALYWEHEGNRAVRVGDWKLVARHRRDWELYDLAADRTEQNDRAADEPERVAAMRARYDEWAKRCGVLPWPVQVKESAERAALRPDRFESFATTDHGVLQLHVFRPDGWRADDARPAIVFFFGGGFVSGAPSQFYPQCRHLAGKGMVAISAEYRTRQSHGTDPFACIADGQNAVGWVRVHAARLGVDPARIAAAGGSAGGHVAAAAAVLSAVAPAAAEGGQSPVPDALILFNPVLDTTASGALRNRFGARAEEASILHHVRPGLPPTLVLCGTADRTTPFPTAQEFGQKMTDAGNRCELAAYEGRTHGFFNLRRGREDFDDTLRRIETFLRSLGFLD